MTGADNGRGKQQSTKKRQNGGCGGGNGGSHDRGNGGSCDCGNGCSGDKGRGGGGNGVLTAAEAAANVVAMMEKISSWQWLQQLQLWHVGMS
jgi:hypothetical protein